MMIHVLTWTSSRYQSLHVGPTSLGFSSFHWYIWFGLYWDRESRNQPAQIRRKSGSAKRSRTNQQRRLMQKMMVMSRDTTEDAYAMQKLPTHQKSSRQHRQGEQKKKHHRTGKTGSEPATSVGETKGYWTNIGPKLERYERDGTMWGRNTKNNIERELKRHHTERPEQGREDSTKGDGATTEHGTGGSKGGLTMQGRAWTNAAWLVVGTQIEMSDDINLRENARRLQSNLVTIGKWQQQGHINTRDPELMKTTIKKLIEWN